MLAHEAAGVAAQFAAGVDDAVARHDDRELVAAVGPRRCAEAFGVVDALRELGVGTRFAVWNVDQCAPDFLLEWRAAEFDGCLKSLQLAGEIVAELGFDLLGDFCAPGHDRVALTLALDFSLKATPIRELEQVERVVVGEREDRAEGGVHPCGLEDRQVSAFWRSAHDARKGVAEAAAGLITGVELGVDHGLAATDLVERQAHAARPRIGDEGHTKTFLKMAPHSGGIEAEGTEIGITPTALGFGLDCIDQAADEFRFLLRESHWVAAFAGAVTSEQGVLRGGEEFAVFALGFTGRAGGAAKDAGRLDAGKEHAFVIAILVDQRLVILICLLLDHAGILAEGMCCCRRKPGVVFRLRSMFWGSFASQGNDSDASNDHEHGIKRTFGDTKDEFGIRLAEDFARDS